MVPTRPGEDYADLACPKLYYWDPASTTPATRNFLAGTPLRQRRLDGLGHWPMLTSPDLFYSTLQADVESHRGG